jgi:hypothetical protein
MTREQALSALSSVLEAARGMTTDTSAPNIERIAAAHAVVQACAMFAKLESKPNATTTTKTEYLDYEESRRLFDELEPTAEKPSVGGRLLAGFEEYMTQRQAERGG